jgi:hypothetical protein
VVAVWWEEGMSHDADGEAKSRGVCKEKQKLATEKRNDI